MSARITVATLAARMDEADIRAAATDVKLDRALGIMERLAARLEADAPAKVEVPSTVATKAPASTKAYRSAKGKEQAKAEVSALWERTLKAAGAKRAKDLTPAQMDAYRAASKAIWAAVPKTRSTKA